MVSTIFPEGTLDPPLGKISCRCDKSADAKAIERFMNDGVIYAEWKGRIGHSITDDIMALLDNYYTYGQCEDCKDSEEAP